jgi:deoxyribodipyrimidine photolyase-related protein
MNILLILPHQLFHKKYFPKETKFNKIILWEHPQYFTKYTFNKKKLILHRASMKYYYDYLNKNKFTTEYYEYKDKPKINTSDNIYIFDPIDNINIKYDYMLESPNFLLNKELYAEYRKKTDKFYFTNFYMWAKQKIDIIPKIKSKDKYNRQKMPNTMSFNSLPSNKIDSKYINEAITYISDNFSSNYGNTDNFIFPTTHKSATQWKKHFFKNNLNSFGPYQDFIYNKEPYLFHSCLSSSLNIGLLNPSEIIKDLKPLQNKYDINSYEGYIRQLFWREYQRYCYIYCDFNKNFFNNKKKLTVDWYKGTLGIKPIDDYIKIGFDTAYLHHIVRLMLIGNFMNLYGISPKEGFKWFMEFSIDSYEWVMMQNVLDMVFFVTGGQTMRKPYITSSNYILHMSTYKKNKWADEWDILYNAFLKKHKDKLWKFRYHFPSLKKI